MKQVTFETLQPLIDLKPDSPAFEERLRLEEYRLHTLKTNLMIVCNSAKEMSQYEDMYLNAATQFGAGLSKLADDMVVKVSDKRNSTQSRDSAAVIDEQSKSNNNEKIDIPTFVKLSGDAIKQNARDRRELVTGIKSDLIDTFGNFVSEKVKHVESCRVTLEKFRLDYTKEVDKFLLLKNKKMDEVEKKKDSMVELRRHVEIARLDLISSLRKVAVHSPILIARQAASVTQSLLDSVPSFRSLATTCEHLQRCVASKAVIDHLNKLDESWDSRCSAFLELLTQSNKFGTNSTLSSGPNKKPPTKKRSFAKKNRELAMTKGQARISTVGTVENIRVVNTSGISAMIKRTAPMITEGAFYTGECSTSQVKLDIR